MNFTSIQTLDAIAPSDGRYRAKLQDLAALVSERALIHYRIRTEAHWLLHLFETLGLKNTVPAAISAALHQWSEQVPNGFAEAVKEIEAITNHDVKAVEYFLKNKLTELGAAPALLSLIHFGCTSEDINNISYALMMRDVRDLIFLPLLEQIYQSLATMSRQNRNTPMLSRTHGQTASPTTLGKEMAVFAFRLRRQMATLQSADVLAKCNGAVGNFNAHHVAYPDVDWIEASRSFIEKRLQLKWNPLTTQIENHDWMASYLQTLATCNQILLGFCRDMWGYISLSYFVLQPKSGEVGSSTMPHKVNPIDFENAEGNLGVANALATHLAEKLPISRWQRDLSDSTALRNIATVAAHSVLAYRAILQGLAKVKPNADRLQGDLMEAVEVLTEAVQSVMRRYGVSDGYERMKDLSRGRKVQLTDLHAAIDACQDIPLAERDRLKSMTPAHYTGLAAALVDTYLE